MSFKLSIINKPLCLASICICLIFYSCDEDPTCFDGELNQDETDIDCGGICEPCIIDNCASTFSNDFTYSVDGVSMDVDSITTYITYDNLAIEIFTQNPEGNILITHSGDLFEPGVYSIGGLSWMLYHTEDNQFHSIIAGSTGTITFTEFNTDPDCPYVTGTLDVNLFEYQTGYNAEISASFTELEY